MSHLLTTMRPFHRALAWGASSRGRDRPKRIVGRPTEDIAILPETLLCFKGKYAWWIALGIELGALISLEDKEWA